MNLLTPPTDSIYKFCGIAGLALFVYLGYYFLTPSQSILEQEKLLKQTNSLNAKTFAFVDELQHNEIVKKDPVKNRVIKNFKIDDVGKDRFGNLIYSLPESFQVKYQALLVQRLDLDAQHIMMKSRIKELKTYDTVFVGLLFVGELLCLWGLANWYIDTKDAKTIELNRRVSESFPSIVCHSCFKQFIFDEERGTEKDGISSKYFCSDCYIDGVYVEPELTFDQARTRLKLKLEKLGYKPKRVKKALKNFEGLYRWKRQKCW